jgi:hypothetical protein
MNKGQELEIRKLLLGSYLLSLGTIIVNGHTVRWKSLSTGPKSMKLYERIFDTRKDTVDVRGKRLKSLARAYGIGIHIEEKETKLLINITLHDPTNDIHTDR